MKKSTPSSKSISLQNVSHRQPNRGFALVISLSLMAFILILILSLTTLIQVETSTSTITRDRLVAENNALLAFNVALGTLQLEAGPDQRVTARADILESTTEENAYFTLAWETQPNNRSVTQPKWLVSSTSDSSTAPVAGPLGTVALVDAKRDGEIPAVEAPKESILGKNEEDIGEYAWWIGDEGIKAKFNLSESNFYRNQAPDPVLRLGTPSRFGIEALDIFSQELDYENPDLLRDLPKLQTADQATIINENLTDALSDSFHDVGFFSHGLLVNTREGGLKRDLTFYLNGGRDDETPSLNILPDGPAIAPFDRITWEQLRDFHDLNTRINGGDNSISARAQTPSQHGVFPVLVMLHLNFGMTLSSNYDGSTNTPADAIDRDYQIHSHVRPWFVLANPYNIPIRVSNYRVRFDPSTVAEIQIAYRESSSGTDKQNIITQRIDRIMDKMVFVVPEVILDPGEAHYYSLDPTSNTAYDYLFSIGTSFHSQLNLNSSGVQQFVFRSDDDDGLTSIRLGNAETVPGAELDSTTGTIVPRIEDDNNGEPRIRQIYWDLTQQGAYTLRTYAGASSTLEDGETLLQEIGPFGSGGIGSEENFSMFHGFWDIENLPSNLVEFDSIAYDIGSAQSSKTLASTAGSLIFALHQAVTQNADSVFSGYDGWATDYNIRAPVAGRFQDAQIYPAAYELQGSHNGAGWFDWIRDPNIGQAPNFPWGAGYSRTFRGPDDPAAKVLQTRLFDIPRTHPGTQQSNLSSLGQLQHFNVSGWTLNPLNTNVSSSEQETTSTLANVPSYAIGNSYASPYLELDQTTRTSNGKRVIDASYLLNEVFFDNYFFSTIPQDAGSVIDFDRLPNKRLKRANLSSTDDQLRTTATSAAENLYVDGAFNVNSTSVEAWYSLLNSFRGLEYGGNQSPQGVFPRSLNQANNFVDGDVSGIGGDADAAWAGWRHIEDTGQNDNSALLELAEEIVNEVKARGPFVSMSDFVNRNLDGNKREGLSGPLQAALDRSLNSNFDNAYEVDFTKIGQGNFRNEGIVDRDLIGSGEILNISGSRVADSSSAASIPGWVTQADLLQALEPVLTTRSDTFTIRTYGNVTDPITGESQSGVYLEGVVQRLPDFVDTSDSPNEDSLNDTNRLTGRRFAVVSLRFIDESSL